MTLQAPTVSHRTQLGKLLWKRRISLAEIARSLDVDRSHVSRWCSGERPIPPKRAAELAELLGVRPKEITG